MPIYGKILKKVCFFLKQLSNCICEKEDKKLMINNDTGNVCRLDDKEKKKIDDIISRLKEAYPVAKRNNLDLISFLRDYYEFQIVEANLPNDITGYIMVDDNNYLDFKNFTTHKIIVTNSNLLQYKNYIQKRRFIIAHEFAHYLLHKKENQIQFAKRDTEHFNTKEEQEAEYFARSFLMPKEDIINILSGKENLSIPQKVDELMKCFNVSENKARYRLQELKLI